MSLIREIRVRVSRSGDASLILSGFVRVLFTLILLVAPQILSASGQGTAQRPTKSGTDNPLRTQHFVCNVGYSRDLCHQHTVKLAEILLRYQQALPDNWTWVLVRSEDWAAILRELNLHPGSPAFSLLAKRQTFLNEVLIGGSAQDRSELLRTFRVPVDQMLDIAVSHELGHAVCMEIREREADRFAEQLRSTRVAQCNGTRNPLAPDTLQTLSPPR